MIFHEVRNSCGHIWIKNTDNSQGKVNFISDNLNVDMPMNIRMETFNDDDLLAF